MFDPSPSNVAHANPLFFPPPEPRSHLSFPRFDLFPAEVCGPPSLLAGLRGNPPPTPTGFLGSELGIPPPPIPPPHPLLVCKAQFHPPFVFATKSFLLPKDPSFCYPPLQSLFFSPFSNGQWGYSLPSLLANLTLLCDSLLDREAFLFKGPAVPVPSTGF